MSKEAMKLALEKATKVMEAACIRVDELKAENASLRQAIAEAEKQEQGEPVAWMDMDEKGAASGLRYWSEPDNRHEVALYTTPPIAQAKQEPLEYWNAVEGWVKVEEVREHFDSVGCGTIYKTAGEGRAPLYTTPQQRTWVGLTEWEREAIAVECGAMSADWLVFMEVVERALKEKNQ